ncbi:MAG: response regulator [Candidatus Hodarchaeales archaeon]|jgi:PAS domain S-box-containing protein
MSSQFLEKPINILHLDDEPDILTISEKFLKRFSEESGNKIVYTGISNPNNFFSSILLNKFDIAIVDYEMPGITGLEILHKLRNEYKNDLPFIIFTGRGREEVAINALNLGANYYIRKGLDFESQYRELFHSIETVVKQKRTEIAFHENEKKYRGLVENLPIIVLIMDKTGIINYANHVTSPYRLEEVIGNPFFDYLIEEDVKRAKELFYHSIDNKIITRGEFNTKIDNIIDVRYIPMIEEEKITEIMAITDVITKRKEIEKSLSTSEEKFRSLFEQTPIAQAERDYSEVKIYLTQIKEKIGSDLENYLKNNPEEVFTCAKKIKLTLVNQAALDLMEVSSEEEFKELIPLKYLNQPKPFESFIKQLVNVEKGELKQSNGVHFFTAKGKSLFLNIIQTVPEEYKRSFKRVWTKYIDVTELKRSQKRLESLQKQI